MAEKVAVGTITHYYTNVGVAVVKLDGTLKAGDKITVEGATTNFEQTADSMQIDREPIQEAGAGQEIGLKVIEKVRTGDKIYKA